MTVGSIHEKLSAFYYIKTFADNFWYTNPTVIKILRLDAPYYDDFNEP